MANPLIFSVEIRRVGQSQSRHYLGQTSVFRGLNHKMSMIVHQTEVVKLKPELLLIPVYKLKKIKKVFFLKEDLLAVIAPV